MVGAIDLIRTELCVKLSINSVTLLAHTRLETVQIDGRGENLQRKMKKKIPYRSAVCVRALHTVRKIDTSRI